MAKQSRARPRPTSRKKIKPDPRQASAGKSARPHPPSPAQASRPADPPRSVDHEAVSLYQRGLQFLQQHAYDRAADLLRQVLERYPDERDLHERVHLYLKVCERHQDSRSPAPRSAQERLYAATLALNAGDLRQAVSHLLEVVRDEPRNDDARYMLAAAYAQKGDAESAATHLRQAIDLNPENRSLALQDPDFERIRQEESFRQATAHVRERPRAKSR
jgi:tetratricopeptide (TPR) repeat protein